MNQSESQTQSESDRVKVSHSNAVEAIGHGRGGFEEGSFLSSSANTITSSLKGGWGCSREAHVLSVKQTDSVLAALSKLEEQQATEGARFSPERLVWPLSSKASRRGGNKERRGPLCRAGSDSPILQSIKEENKMAAQNASDSAQLLNVHFKKMWVEAGVAHTVITGPATNRMPRIDSSIFTSNACLRLKENKTNVIIRPLFLQAPRSVHFTFCLSADDFHLKPFHASELWLIITHSRPKCLHNLITLLDSKLGAFFFL